MDDDKIRINLIMAGITYPLVIRRSDEEIYRKAAKEVETYINKYKEKYPKVANEMILAMVAYHFSLKSLLEEDRNDTKPFTDKIKELTDEMESYMNEEGKL